MSLAKQPTFLAITLFVLVSTGCFSRSDTVPNAPPQSHESNSVVKTGGDGLFVDEKAGFCVSYDPDWKLIPPRNSIQPLVLVPTDDSIKAEMSITAISSSYQAPDEFVKEQIAKRKGSMKNISNSTEKLLEIGTTTISGFDAFFEKNSQPENMVAYSVNLHYKSRRYMLLLRTTKDKFDQTFVAFMKLKDTFAVRP